MKLPRSKKGKRNGEGASPTRHLEEELAALRRDLRTTLRAYAAGLEIHLAETVAAIAVNHPEELSRERQQEIRDLTSLVRSRKLKPEKGRRKDLRKLDELIGELHSATHPLRPR